MKTIVLFLAATLLLAGCPRPSQPPPEMQPLYNPNQTTTPDWVLRGAGAMTGDKGKVLYGVGSAPKMIDISIATCGVTPPGGEKTWCEVDDIDALATADGLGFLKWGGTQTTTTPSWTYDFDDFIWWIEG